jgi:hypothetical protein
MARHRSLRHLVALTLALTPLAIATPAAAEPATTISYPAAASATRFNGLAFDTCAAPSTTTMQAWRESPYGGVGIYLGGANRTCGQPNLTASWVRTVSSMSWRIIPIWMGRQAPCTYRPNATTFSLTSASTDGTTDARDAVRAAKLLGMVPGSAIYGDMENYDRTNTSCRSAVLRFLSSWTKELHRQGYLSGVYAGLISGARHLSDAFHSTSYARPDALWVARWDLTASLTGWEDIPDTRWAGHQRAKQYRGDHDETHGGVRINIDSDRFDAPVATATFGRSLTASTPVNGRSGPSTSSVIVKTYPPSSNVTVVCQTTGSMVADTTAVWDKLTDGNYVSDWYVNTWSDTSYSPPLPRCSYPYQVTASTMNQRTGPGFSYPVMGSLWSGSLAWVTCQRVGEANGTTSVWDRLIDHSYVTDRYLATPSATTYSKPIPRC